MKVLIEFEIDTDLSQEAIEKFFEKIIHLKGGDNIDVKTYR